MGMDKHTQRSVAAKAGCTDTFLCKVLEGVRRPSWKMAKRLAEATGTDPVLWLEGDPSSIRIATKLEKRGESAET